MLLIRRCRDRREKDHCGAPLCRTESRRGRNAVHAHSGIHRARTDGLWEVRLEGHLLSGQPTQMEALGVAQALAQAGALRGDRSKILVGALDGEPIEFPTVGPLSQLA